MSPLFMIPAILLPILGGICLPAFHVQDDRLVKRITMAVTLTVSLLVWGLILLGSDEPLYIVNLAHRLYFILRLDGLGRFFAGIVATLWPLTTLYSFEYLEQDGRKRPFYVFFLLSYGATLGVAMAGNLFSLYCFYELLTLATVPLVLHTQTPAAIRATRLYLTISIGGAAFVFLSIVYLVFHHGPLVADAESQVFFLMGFFGFAVKAAVFPLHVWLPKASVAPTPVTALLHAVAVVKAGVFAIIRLTWCSYGPALLSGTPAQAIALSFVIFTIVFGSAAAVKEAHFKRRMAYSTVANLSYILFGALLLSEEGLGAGLLHMAYHAELKILLFFCVGIVMEKTGREYLYQLDGLGKRMPLTFGCFAVGALGLIGIPPFAGFVSKWNLLSAGLTAGTLLSGLGTAALLISALLTAVYCLTPLRRAFFPDDRADLSALSGIHDPGWRMSLPIAVLAVGILITGLWAGSLENAVAGIIQAIRPW